MSDWKKVELQNAATINPSRPRKSSITDPEESVSFVEMAAVSEDTCQIEYEEEREIMEVRADYTYFDRDDVLLAKITPCFENGKVAVADIEHERGFGSTEFHVFRPDRSRLDGRYLYYFLRNPAFRKQAGQEMTGSAGQKRIPTRYIKEVEIPLPPLDMQRRIVMVLDRADALRKKRRKAFGRFDELLQSYFVESFGDPLTNPKGWNTAELDNHITIDAGWSAKGEDRERKSGEHAVLKISAVTGGRFTPNECKVVPKEELRDDLVRPQKGDVLFSRANTRELVAATCIVEDDYPHHFLPDKLWRVTPDDDRLLPEYLRYLLANERFRRELKKRATGTSGSMLNIAQYKLRESVAPLPPLELQRRFEEIVWKVYDIRQNVSDSIERISKLFDTLLHRAFRGELNLNEAALETEIDTPSSVGNGCTDEAAVTQGDLFSDVG